MAKSALVVLQTFQGNVKTLLINYVEYDNENYRKYGLNSLEDLLEYGYFIQAVTQSNPDNDGVVVTTISLKKE